MCIRDSIEHPTPLEPIQVAKLLSRIVEQEQPELILMGKQAIDDDANQTGQMLAQIFSYPQATFASKITLTGNTLEVVREVDQGLEILDIDLPAIVTVDLRLNEPRYVKLPDIMKAKKKPLEVLDPVSLDVSLDPSIKVLNVSAPPPRQSGVMLEDASQLVSSLKEKGLLND